jgi:hypothetical protein
MDHGEFSKLFGPDQEIGRATTDAQLSVYFDNGAAIGVWRHDRATTHGRGEILSKEEARLARSWFSRCKVDPEQRPAPRRGGFDVGR